MEKYEEYVQGLDTRKSYAFNQRARNVIPEGASSGVRLWDPYGIEFVKGKGSKIWDADGNEYIDYILGMGPSILGHANPVQIEAVKKVMENGPTMFVGLSEPEVKLAEKIKEMCDVDMVRFCNSGSEATLHAIRWARAYTQKDKIIKFEGHYHGWHDYTYFYPSNINDPIPAYKVPGSWGIPEDTLKTMIQLPWNDLEILEKTIKRHGNEIAGVITEPIMMNVGCVPPKEGYLKGIQELCNENDLVFILDEVISGFRLAPGGAAEYYHLEPDIKTYAKALGAGYPIGATTGKKKILELLEGSKILHGGTFNGQPLVVTASLATLNYLTANNNAAFKHIEKIAVRLTEGLNENIDKTKTHGIVQGVGAAGSQLYFTELKEITNWRESQQVDSKKFLHYHKELMKRGILIHPWQDEHIFVSTAHTEEDIEKHIAASLEALKTIS